MSASESPVRPGDLIADKYRVQGVLGVGGMGVVVAAMHEQLEQRVAIKFLLSEVLDRPEIVTRFLREARAAVRIRSEHVARILDTGTLPTGAPYMVMEHLEGEDLEQLVERVGAMPPPVAVGYVLEACEALAEAHAMGIVHRDIKPANLFLARRPSGDTIKVLDFGISKIPLTDKEQALTHETSIVGSPAYMSPEQVQSSRDVDQRSDVYSLGVVLFQLLTKNPPFNGTSMAALVAAVLLERAPLVTLARPDVPKGLAQVVARCLEKEPARRYSDVGELSRALLPFGPAGAAHSIDRIEKTIGRTSGDRTADLQRFDPVVGEPRPFSSTISAQPHRARNMWLVGMGAALIGGAAAIGLFRTALSPAHAPASVATLAPNSVRVDLPPGSSLVASSAPSAVSTMPAPPTVTASEAASAPATASATASADVRAPSSVRAPPVAKPTPAAAATPACKSVPFFDAVGTKHFRWECK